MATNFSHWRYRRRYCHTWWQMNVLKLWKESTSIKCDVVDKCAFLLNHWHKSEHNPVSASISQWALSVTQSTLRSEVETNILEELLRGPKVCGRASSEVRVPVEGCEHYEGWLVFKYRHRETGRTLLDNVILFLEYICWYYLGVGSAMLFGYRYGSPILYMSSPAICHVAMMKK